LRCGIHLVSNNYLAHVRGRTFDGTVPKAKHAAPTLRLGNHKKLPGGVNGFRYRVVNCRTV
jgi:hypothetical protein